MARDDLTLKLTLDINTLLDGEPEELEYIRQAIREKRERDKAEGKRGMCYVTVCQDYMLSDALHLPKDKHYEVLSTRLDSDGNVVLCLSGDDLPTVKDGEDIPYGNIVCHTVFYDNEPKCTEASIEFCKRG